MECLDELSLGVRGQTLGKDKDCPPIALPTAADHTASMTNALQTLFDVPRQTLVHLSPAIRWEQDPTSSKSVSRDLLQGALLHAMLPTSALRYYIQMPCCLAAKPDFAVDFHLPPTVANSYTLRLPDGRWELGTSI